MKHITMTLALALALIACEQSPEAKALNAKVDACTLEMSDEEVANLNGLADATGKEVYEACVAHAKGDRHLMNREEWEEAKEAQRLEDEANGLNY